MTDFTEEQLVKYKDDGCLTCPECGNSNIYPIGPLIPEGHFAWQTIECSNCNTVWHDGYQLISITKID